MSDIKYYLEKIDAMQRIIESQEHTIREYNYRIEELEDELNRVKGYV